MQNFQNPIPAKFVFDEKEFNRLGGKVGFSFGSLGPTGLPEFDFDPPEFEISVHADIGISKRPIRGVPAVAVLLEPKELLPGPYRSAILNRARYSLILTYDSSILALGAPFVPYTPGGTLSSEYPTTIAIAKDNLVSMSISSKATLPGHQLRHQAHKRLKYLDVQFMGRHATPYQNPFEPYLNSAFTIAIENVQHHHYFTEKLIEPLLAKCVPIYWGAAGIDELFNMDGIIRFESIEELKQIVAGLSFAKYKKLQAAIEENYLTALSFSSKDKNIVESIEGHLSPEAFHKSVKNLDYGRSRRIKSEEGVFRRARREWKYRVQGLLAFMILSLGNRPMLARELRALFGFGFHLGWKHVKAKSKR